MCTDCLIPYGFNFLRKCFVPKKKYITHKAGIAAKSSDLRPLWLENSDIKAISSAMIFSLAPVASKCSQFSQRGFVWGRTLILNAIELDTFARIFSGCFWKMSRWAFSSYVFFLCFFDFLSAFPSVAHDYLFRVLEFYGCPLGIRNFIFSLFIDVAAYTSAGGLNAFLSLSQSGVIQGDPMAVFLFVVIFGYLAD